MKHRYYLPCADDDGNPNCYMCGVNFSSMKFLYHHMLLHTDSDWLDILPPEPLKSIVIVCRSLLPTMLSNFDTLDEDLKFNDEKGFNDDDGENQNDEILDLMKFLPPWKVTDRRGRPAVVGKRGSDCMQMNKRTKSTSCMIRFFRNSCN
ncbi:unnamed protein product [Lactuca saligna]|uniref:C2H2-type domain-containing protein n=1 Tax=Lactuca saligna TaxID=75948 RepID=A0AA36A713_LACSI|nr:unnamed protein product [Lactuca saligna]